MRHVFFTTAGFILCLGLTSQAQATPMPSSLCPHYGGYVSVEGRLGNERNIAETSAFLPVACSSENLFFSDLRIKGDNISNREMNIGLGVRSLKNHGVLGTYIYFDRKKSGYTDKLHSQTTIGADWLTEYYELRANAYIPLTDKKQARIPLAQSVASAPFLQGSGLYVNNFQTQIVEEEALWGGDAEVGFKLPDTKLWLHAGAFTFHGDDADMNGVRTRATYQLTDNIALTAEGQYDNMRGRMGWLGVRFTVPFGGPAEKPQGLRARMTAAPVRDVDIVTTPKVIGYADPGPPEAVKNAESGDAQRILYVDNTAAAGGNGSKERPFNTLSDAQSDLRDHDIVYVYSGLGDTGQDSGFTIDRRGVQFIGNGTALVYDSKKFTAARPTGNINGVVLIAAGDRPTITNNGAVIVVNASDVTVTGISAQSASAEGILIEGDGNTVENVNVYNVTASGNASHGILARARNGGTIRNLNFTNTITDGNSGSGVMIQSNNALSYADQITIRNAHSEGNTLNGIIVQALGNGDIGEISLDGVNAQSNSNHGIFIQTTHANSDIDSVTMRNITTSDSGAQGTYIQANNGTIHDVRINTLTSTDNTGNGLYVQATNNGTVGALSLTRGNIQGNTQNGLYIQTATSGGNINSAVIQHSTITANQRDGIFLNHDSAGTFVVDLGGGGESAGYNRIFGNGLFNPANFRDMKLDTNAGPDVPAQYNWWGQDTGPLPTQIIDEGAAPNTGTADTDNHLQTDPGL